MHSQSDAETKWSECNKICHKNAEIFGDRSDGVKKDSIMFLSTCASSSNKKLDDGSREIGHVNLWPHRRRSIMIIFFNNEVKRSERTPEKFKLEQMMVD